MALVSRRNPDRIILFARTERKAGVTPRAQFLRRTNLRRQVYRRPSNNVPPPRQRIVRHCADRRSAGNTSMSLPTAASCLSRGTPSRSNGPTLSPLPEAVFPCPSACNHPVAAAKQANSFSSKGGGLPFFQQPG